MDESGGYSDFPFVAEFYDYVGPYRTREDVGFYIEMAKAADGRVLEVGCGTGRVVIPIAREGITITGIDLSHRMLDMCRQKVLAEPEDVRSRITLAQADMRALDLHEEFALATIPFRPFHHLLTVEDQLNCLNSIWRHLTRAGLLVIDIFNPSLANLTEGRFLEEQDVEPEFEMPDGRVVKRAHRTVSRDLFNQINQQELIYYVRHPDGRAERLVHSFSMRYLFRFEAEHLLARAGFELMDVFSGYDRSPYGSAYPGELIMVAKKIEPGS